MGYLLIIDYFLELSIFNYKNDKYTFHICCLEFQNNHVILLSETPTFHCKVFYYSMENSEKQNNIEVQNEEIPFEHPVQV